jgi:hypothetical protein
VRVQNSYSIPDIPEYPFALNRLSVVRRRLRGQAQTRKRELPYGNGTITWLVSQAIGEEELWSVTCDLLKAVYQKEWYVVLPRDTTK